MDTVICIYFVQVTAVLGSTAITPAARLTSTPAHWVTTAQKVLAFLSPVHQGHSETTPRATVCQTATTVLAATTAVVCESLYWTTSVPKFVDVLQSCTSLYLNMRGVICFSFTDKL